MHLYRQPIIVFGIILPLVASAALVAVCSTLRSKLNTSYETKVTNYKSAQLGRIAALEVEKKLVGNRPASERWVTQLSLGSKSLVNKNIREITADPQYKEITNTGTDSVTGKTGFGGISAQNSSQISLNFRGTYRALQSALFELETRMPELQLQELQITPNSTQSTLLNFKVNYTAWEN